ncbi:MAG: hypothetical protein V4717_14575 [Bacteroidota bacterium]
MIPEEQLRSGNYVMQGDKYRQITAAEIPHVSLTCDPVHLLPPVLEACKNFTRVNGDWITTIEKRNCQLTLKLSGDKVFLNGLELLNKPFELHNLQNLYYSLAENEMDLDLLQMNKL